MEKIKIVRSGNVESGSLPGLNEKAGWVKRVITPATVSTKGIFMNIAEINPGYAGHPWHDHIGRHKSEGYEVIYPKDFEEIYHIVSGSGVVQWKTADGKINEERVSAGDTIFFPADAPEHQLFNDGAEKICMIGAGSPPPKVTISK